MKKIIIIIIITILLVILFHVRYFFKINNNYEILQMENFEKKKYENNIKLKLPLLIRNYNSVIDIQQLSEIENIIGNKKTNVYLTSPFIGTVKQTKINSNDLKNIKNWQLFLNEDLRLTKYGDYLKSKLSINQEHYINVGLNKTNTGLLSSTYNRTCIYITNGECKIQLYNPKELKYLYSSNFSIQRFKFSNINLENIEEKYKNFKNAKFIEIILRAGNLLYIPRHWWWSLNFIDDCIYILFNSDTIVSKMVSLV